MFTRITTQGQFERQYLHLRKQVLLGYVTVTDMKEWMQQSLEQLTTVHASKKQLERSFDDPLTSKIKMEDDEDKDK